MAAKRRLRLLTASILLACVSSSFCQLHWTQVSPLPTAQTLWSVVWTGTQFVAVGDSGVALTSPEGATWTLHRTGSARQLYGVARTDSQVVALGYGGIILTSPDGIAWTQRSSVWTNALWGAAWTGSLLVAVGLNEDVFPYQGMVLTSPDGITWTPRLSDSTADLSAVTYTGSQLVAVGSNSTRVRIATSPDGLVWSLRASDAFMQLNAVAASDTQIVAVGANGAIVSSADGIVWTDRNSGLPQGPLSGLNGIIWTGTEFVAVGTGCVLTSPDGIIWTSGNVASQPLLGVTCNGSLLVAVGWNGTILTAPLGTAVLQDQPRSPFAAPVAGILASPSRLSFTLHLLEPSIVRGSLHNLCGQTIFAFVNDIATPGVQSMQIPLPGLAAGDYLLEIRTASQRECRLVLLR